MIKKLIFISSLLTTVLILNFSDVAPAYAIDLSNSNNSTKMDYTNLDVSDLIYDINSIPFNVSYAEWTEKWWQWAYSISQNVHPAYDDTGEFCQENQKEPVWFLPGTYQHSVIRYCEIPSNVGILFPILNSECSFIEYPKIKTENGLRNCAKTIQDTVIPQYAMFNGIRIPNLEDYRVQSNIFNITLPQNNILNLPPLTTQAISDGNWVFLKPLSPGEYKLEFKGDVKTKKTERNNNTDKDEFAGPIGWNYTTIYILKVK